MERREEHGGAGWRPPPDWNTLATMEPEPVPAWLEDKFYDIVDSGDSGRGLAKLCDNHPEFAPTLREWAQSVLSTPSREDALAEPTDGELPARIGPYRVLGLVGRGGMGEVYAAEQLEPVQRRVAIKVIKLGMDTKEVLARFEAERQALAMMNHPNIARVIDAGVAGGGRPYFVMELVRGCSIKQYCERNKIDLDARLRLLIETCHGVQHAHHKGVMHRDLKPSNIMVEMQDGAPVPRIIDFGLARAVDQRPLTDKTIYTEPGRFLGSPEYMSPEQAEMSGADVDTRTDVYSLGVVLYELLTGVSPFQRLGSKGIEEIQRCIREETPSKPSTRLTQNAATSGRSAPDPSALTPTAFVNRVRGDLDRVVMKALEKDRTQRYQTPTGLAADLERFLSHQPVLATPPSKRYRALKWLQRNRMAATAGALVFASLVGGLTIATWQHLVADEARASSASANSKAQYYLDAFNRLADGGEIRRLQARAQTLWPAWPRHRGELQECLDGVRRQLGPLHDHRRTLEDLRRQPTAGPETGIRRAYLIGGLEEIVRDLEEIQDPVRGLEVSLERRLAWATEIRESSIVAARSDWQRAINAIGQSDLYRKQRLTPQLGLVPLAPNPQGLWEFSHLASGERPEHNSEGELVISEDTGLVFVLVPRAYVTVGAQLSDNTLPHFDVDAVPIESPPFSVSLEAFFVSKYEMTQAQWVRLVTEFGAVSTLPPSNPATINRDKYPGITRLNPIETVSWIDCRTLLNSYGLELPTEAQWEYAARGGSDAPWWTGSRDRLLHNGPAANIADATTIGLRGRSPQFPEVQEWPEYDDGAFFHAAVNRYRPNPFGLYNVLGNVKEWCLDSAIAYDKAQPRDGDGLLQAKAPAGDVPHEVNGRGGDFAHGVTSARVTSRRAASPQAKASTFGVRPARPLIVEERR